MDVAIDHSARNVLGGRQHLTVLKFGDLALKIKAKVSCHLAE